MRVAICFSGAIRSFETCFPSIYKNLIQPTKADVFVRLLKYNTEYDDSKLETNMKIQNDECSVDYVLEKLKPVSYLIEDFTPEIEHEFIERCHGYELIEKVLHKKEPEVHKGYLINAMGMYYGIQKVNNLRKQYEQEHNIHYDIVIRARLDFKWNYMLSMDDLILAEEQSIVLLKDQFATISGTRSNDKFFFSVSQVMDVYCDLYDNLFNLCLKMGIDNAKTTIEGQSIAAKWIVENRLRIKWIGDQYSYEKLLKRHRIPYNRHKVLVTGCCGFIGSHVTEKLLENGYTVYGIDNQSNEKLKMRKELNLQLLQCYRRFIFINEDILTTKCIEQYKPNVVIHLAAKTGVRESLLNPMEYSRINIEGHINLLEQCVKSNVNLYLYASSSSVYGLNKKVPFKEVDDLGLPNSQYACSKVCMEQYSALYNRLYGLRTIGFRFFTVYGPRGRYDMAPYIFLNNIHNEISINKYGDGSTSRDYTYVNDIVGGIYNTVKKYYIDNQEIQHIIYNLGSNKPHELNYLIKQCEEIVGNEAIINQLEEQKGDVPITYADITLASNELDYNPSTELRDGLQQMYKWLETYKYMYDII